MNAFQAENLSLGRNCLTADSAELTTFSDGGAQWVLRWADGATRHQYCFTKEEALADLRRLGWAP